MGLVHCGICAACLLQGIEMYCVYISIYDIKRKGVIIDIYIPVIKVGYLIINAWFNTSFE